MTKAITNGGIAVTIAMIIIANTMHKMICFAIMVCPFSIASDGTGYMGHVAYQPDIKRAEDLSVSS